MATLNRMLTMAAFACLAFAGCGKLVGLDIPATPLAQIHFVVTGVPSVLGADAGEQDGSSLSGADAGEQDASAEQGNAGVQAQQWRVALVWGAQSLPEPFCVRPPESVAPVHLEAGWRQPSADDVVQKGCPDIFRFVPNLSGPDVAVEPDEPGTIDLINLPAADLMVGDLTARIAYASLVVYDDRNGNGILDFRHPQQGDHEDEHYNPGTPATRDIPYGASFINMTLPDQRVAYHEGGDFSAAFYPRPGCGQAPPNFSILSAGGFPRPDLSQDAALLALSLGQLPEEDPTKCVEAKLDEAVVTIPLLLPREPPQPWPPPVALKELACTVNNTDGTTLYHRPPDTAPDLAHLDWACVGFPHLPGDVAGVTSGQQLVVAGDPNDPCQYVNHYTLRGCDNDPSCAAPSWDYTTPKNPPPSWWPCPTTP